MDMHHVRYFLAASRSLNFSRAAEACNVSVPTLSRAIRQLEDELGGQLFRRERHLTHLTDLGRLMQQHLATIDAAAEAARREASDYTRLAQSRLVVGMFASIGAGLLADFLVALRDRAPGLELRIWEAHCEELENALLQGEVDVAISSAPAFDQRLRSRPLFQEAYFVAFAPGHRFEQLNAVPLRELEGEAYIKRLHCEFPTNFMRLGVAKPYREVDVRYVGEREDWVQAMLRAGLGITLMPEHLPLLDGILMRPIVEPEVSRTVSTVTVVGRPHSPPVARVPARGARLSLARSGRGAKLGLSPRRNDARAGDCVPANET